MRSHKNSNRGQRHPLAMLGAILSLAFFATGSASAVTPTQATYDVWGGNVLDLNQSYGNVDNLTGLGYVKLGSTNRTATFHGQYNYYVVAVKKTDILYLDAAQTSTGAYYNNGSLAGGNWAGTAASVFGAPDRVFLVLNGPTAGSGSTSTYGSTAIFYNTGGWTSMKFLVYEPQLGPGIGAQPGKQIAATGDTAQLKIGAIGEPTLRYQWRKDGTDLVNDGRISGAAGTNLSVMNLGLGDSGNYSVVVTNTYGSITSAVAALTVFAPRQATYDVWGGSVVDLNQSYYNVDKLAGEFRYVKLGSTNRTATFSGQYNHYVVAVKKTEILFLDAAQTSTGGFYNTGGQTSGNTGGNGTIYGAPDGRYVLLNGPGIGASTSTYGSYTIFHNPGGWTSMKFFVYSPDLIPVITTQPETQAVATSGKAQLKVGAFSEAPLFYQWRKNGTNLVNGGRITGATSTNLTITSAQAPDGGNYSVVVSNAYGSVVSSNAVLTVIPASQTFSIPDYYHPVYTGNEWIYDSQDNSSTWTTICRITAANLPVTFYSNCSPVQAYTCNAVPVNWIQGYYSGGGGFSIVNSWTNFMHVGDASFGFMGFDHIDGDRLRFGSGFVFTNRVALGQTLSKTATIYDHGVCAGPGTFTFQLIDIANIHVPAGFFADCLHIKTTFVSGGVTRSVDVGWWAKGVGPVKEIHGDGVYWETNELHSFSIVRPPRITTPPQSRTNSLGSTASFTVTVMGDEPLYYQWRRNRQDLVDNEYISGANTTNLVITSLDYSDAAGYDVVVHNDYGSVTGAVAVLTVGTPTKSFVLMDYFHPMVAGNEWIWSGTDYDGDPTKRVFRVEDVSWPLVICTPTRTYTNVLARMYKAFTDPNTMVPSDTWYEYFNVSGRLGMWGMDDDPGEYEARIDGGLVFPTNMIIGQPVSVTRNIYTNCVLETQWTMQLTILDWTAVTVPAGTFPDCLHIKMAITQAGQTQTSEHWWARGVGSVKQHEVPDVGEKRLELIAYNVNTAPQIITPPRSQTNSLSSVASFTAVATGSRPLNYQWQRNGVDLTDDSRITGATSNNLIIADLQYADAGSFDVVMRNNYGSRTSAPPAVLTVNETIPPSLAITSHTDLQLLGIAAIILAGTASDAGHGDNGIASVTVNGLRATNDIASGGNPANWSRVVNLVLGTNKLAVIAKDGRGNSVTNTIRIISDTARPLLAIQFPLNGARVLTNSGLVTVRGTSSDNRKSVGVWYELNGGDWTNAVTVNNWTNWSATVPMQMGTNVVQAYAQDEAGNRSPTNSVAFQYVVTSPVTLQVVGKGTVVGLTNSQQLELGRAYSFNATAGLGFALTNWTVEVDSVTVASTNRLPIRFTMASNLTLRVTFTDKQKPVLKITSPLSGARITNEQATVRGKVTDNGWVETVQWRLNGSEWATALGTTNWETNITLQPGTNWFEAYATDREGLRSVTNRAAYFRVVTNLMTVSKSGKGTITPDYNGKWLEIGRRYNMMAKPGLGFVFTNWTDGADQVVTNKSPVNFMMITNLALRANFVDVQKPVLTILSPLSGARITNELATVRGKVTDNGWVETVLWRLNGSEWATALGTTNWEANITLQPGTNWFEAYATDRDGLRSVTNRAAYFRVVTNLMTVAKSGKGTITPDYNGKWLEIGRRYNMMAKPGLGFVFTNWTDGADQVVTNKLSVSFMMITNLALRANFVDVQKPVVTITAPTPGKRWSNAVFTVMGKTTDNDQVAALWYQLNTNDWAMASSTNVWTNWMASVNLTPGPNMLRAYAVDATGNRSLTNSVSFIHVVSAPLCAQISGCGTVIPKDGTLLEIGKPVTATATPCAGYVLTNWTVQVDGVTVTSTNRPVPFVMRSNLCLYVTLVDVQKPVVAITAPTLNQRWSNAVFTVAGKVADNGPMAAANYQLNDGDWTAAQTTNSWSNWTATVTLRVGTNTLRAYAMDAAGKRSVTNSVNFVYVLSDRLKVVLVGKGTLSPNYSNALLEINRGYTMTATPGTGYAFTNWTGQVEGEVVQTTNKAALNFVMKSNLVLTATFADVQKPSLAITNPAGGIRVSNAVVDVKGWAQDNAGVSNVWVSVNAADFAAATLLNNGTNWVLAAQTLEPGTNVVRAYAVDPSGNVSLTVTSRVVYVKTYSLEEYFHPISVGNQWVYKWTHDFVTPTNSIIRVESTSYPLTCYRGRSVPTPYVTNVISLYSSYCDYRNGVEVNIDDTWYEYYTTNSGVRIWGSDDDPGTIPDPDQERMRVDGGSLFGGKLAVGQTVTTTRDFYEDGVFQGAIPVSVQLISYTNVIVPAGIFSDCLHLRVTLNIPGGPTSFEDWWAKGVGMVKKKRTSSGGHPQVYELAEFSLVGAAYVVATVENESLVQRDVSATRSVSSPPLQFDCSKGKNALVANGCIQMRLTGPAGAVAVVESSTDLLHWVSVQTNTLPAEGLPLSIPMGQQPSQFFRARLP